MSHSETIKIVKSVFSQFKVEKIEKVQSLWSGYGEISRFKVVRDNHSFNNCILKYIDFLQQQKHPRGWHGEFSHKRKLDSYYNEQLFYQSFAHHLPDSCKVPALLATGSSDNNLWLIIEDLDQIGLTERLIPTFSFNHKNHAPGCFAIARSTQKPVIESCLSQEQYLLKVFEITEWLASFHGFFLNTLFDKFEKPGTYWHLNTRPQEFETMPDSHLKKSARKIDKILKHANFQTLVHGDAKIANFCFNANLAMSRSKVSVAAVDFQYVGKGVGVKDLIYLLGSCFDSDGLYKYSRTVEILYFEKLKQLLLTTYNWPSDSIRNLIAEWQRLIPLAWADFERFLVGWAVEHAKLNDYSANQTNKALQIID